MHLDEKYMQRCFDLAHLGAGNVAPNPMVGAVIVYQQRIIGEGFHQKYGGPHAEVNAVNSVSPKDQKYLPQSTLFVSLEPCCIFGNTPPCTDLILRTGFPRVVVSALDATPQVAGNGVALLRKHGIRVETGLLQTAGEQLASIRNTYAGLQRPYVILKFAQTRDGWMGDARQTIHISNQYTKRLVHKWRSESSAILVGSKTAALDNPQLNNRFFFGASPLPIVLDPDLKLPLDLHLFQDENRPVWVLNRKKENQIGHLQYVKVDFSSDWIPQLFTRMIAHKKSSLLVEGGAQTLQTFLDSGLWDEARVIVSQKTWFPGNVPAPRIPAAPSRQYPIGSDEVLVYFNRAGVYAQAK